MKLTLLVFTFAASTAFAAVTMPTAETVTIKNGKGDVVGNATITELAHGVKVDMSLHNMTPGEHAMHFHEKSVCTGPKFESAGGHFAPGKNPHGFDMAGGPHAGDMPNFFVGSDGTAKVEVVDEAVTLKKGAANSLLKGTALVIHEKADDYKSQPAGDAGGRAACGEIKAQ